MPRKTSRPRGRRIDNKVNAPASRAHDIPAAMDALDQIDAPTPKAAKAIALLSAWLADESGYDEQTWPRLKRSLERERKRVGARSLFDA